MTTRIIPLHVALAHSRGRTRSIAFRLRTSALGLLSHHGRFDLFVLGPNQMHLDLGNGLHLTEFRRSDQAALVAHLNDKDIYDRTLRIPHPYTITDAQTWFEIDQTATRQHGQPVHFAIRDATGELIGGCGFDGLAIGKSHRAEIGYWLARPYWGRGIMTNVVRVACTYAFVEWGLVKIAAHVFPFNNASARVLEKCGFEQEGYLKKHSLKDGQLVDSRLYGLVK